MRATPEDLADIDAANAAFLQQAQRLGLRWRCEDCAHGTPAPSVCSLGYPNADLTGPPRAITPQGALTFCKFFELGES